MEDFGGGGGGGGGGRGGYQEVFFIPRPPTWPGNKARAVVVLSSDVLCGQ